MTARLQELVKKQASHGRSFLLPLLLIAAGGALIAKELDLHPFLKLVPDNVLIWSTAIGSILGGLYMIMKRFSHKKIII